MAGMRDRVGIAAVAATLLGLVACSSSGGSGDGVGSSLSIALTFGGTAPIGPDVAWLDGTASAGDTQIVQVMARDITLPFDGFGFELSFDPAIARVESVTSGGFLLSCTGGFSPVAVNNLTPQGANDSGLLIVSEILRGSAPPECTLVGQATLALITFRARTTGTANLALIPCTGSDPSVATGSCFYRSATPTTLVPVDAANHRAASLEVAGS